MKERVTESGTIQNCRKQNWVPAQIICCMTAVLVEQTFQPPLEMQPETSGLLAAGTLG